MTRDRVAIYGGSFDPPHRAHVAAVRAVLAHDAADLVLVLPAARHAFAKALTPFADRLAMCRLAFAPIGAACEVRDDEKQLVDGGGDGTTIALVRHLARRGMSDLRLIIGTDQLASLHRWVAAEELFARVTPILLGRPGHAAQRLVSKLTTTLPAPICELADVSSTAIRARLHGGGDAGPDVSDEVAAYIARHGLYGG